MALTKVKAGNILLTTPGVSSNDVTPATTQYVTTAIGNLIDTAPSTLNTLNELAAALGDDVNFSTTVTNSIATKLPLAGGTLTGNLSIGGATPQGNLTIKGAVSDDIDLLTFSENGTDQSFSFNGNFAGSGQGGNNLTLDSYWTNDIMSWVGDGKVGIGTDAPTHGLTVSDLSGGDDANMRRITIKSETHGVNSGFRFDSESANGTARGGGYYFVPGDTDATTYLGLSATDTGYQMAIARNGKIAMGSATDGTAPLHLKYADGSYNTEATSGFISHATSGRGLIRIRSDADAAAELFFDVNGAIRWDISARQSSETYDMQWYNQAATPAINVVAGPVMVLTQTGRLGVGVTQPSYPLHVSGVAAATSFLGNGSTLTGIAKLTVASSAPSSPSVGDQWFDSTSTILAMKVWTGVFFIKSTHLHLLVHSSHKHQDKLIC